MRSIPEVQGVVRGTPYWDNAYNNIAFFIQRGNGTLQVAVETLTTNGASFLIRGVVSRPQALDQIRTITFQGAQRFMPLR
jgi:hypothetical protein